MRSNSFSTSSDKSVRKVIDRPPAPVYAPPSPADNRRRRSRYRHQHATPAAPERSCPSLAWHDKGVKADHRSRLLHGRPDLLDPSRRRYRRDTGRRLRKESDPTTIRMAADSSPVTSISRPMPKTSPWTSHDLINCRLGPCRGVQRQAAVGVPEGRMAPRCCRFPCTVEALASTAERAILPAWRSMTSSQSPCRVPVAQPARRPDDNRKTLASRGQGLVLEQDTEHYPGKPRENRVSGQRPRRYGHGDLVRKSIASAMTDFVLIRWPVAWPSADCFLIAGGSTNRTGTHAVCPSCTAPIEPCQMKFEVFPCHVPKCSARMAFAA